MLDPKGQELLTRWSDIQRQVLDAMANAVREIGLESLEQMVHNLSGQDVTWSGGTFRVNVQTGNLRRHSRLEYPFAGDPYSVMIFNNASYAPDIEEGVSGYERKRRLLEGGQSPKKSKQGRAYKRIPGGKGSLIPYWTVTEDSKLADQPPRPFTAATAEQMKERAIELLGAVTANTIKGGPL